MQVALTMFRHSLQPCRGLESKQDGRIGPRLHYVPPTKSNQQQSTEEKTFVKTPKLRNKTDIPMWTMELYINYARKIRAMVPLWLPPSSLPWHRTTDDSLAHSFWVGKEPEADIQLPQNSEMVCRSPLLSCLTGKTGHKGRNGFPDVK